MGLKEVKEDVLKDAQETADQIIREAEEERDRIIEDAEKEVKKIQEDAEKELEKEKESIRRKKLSNARMKARREKLETKQEYIDRTYDQFREKLSGLSDEEKERFVETCLEKIDFGVGHIRASDGFLNAVDGSYDTREIEDEGIVIVSENGERRQDFTLDKIVEDYRNRHRQEVSKVLFGGGE